MSYAVAAMAFFVTRGVRPAVQPVGLVELWCGSRAAAAMPRRLETVGKCALSTTHAVSGRMQQDSSCARRRLES